MFQGKGFDVMTTGAKRFWTPKNAAAWVESFRSHVKKYDGLIIDLRELSECEQKELMKFINENANGKTIIFRL